jgi:quinol-cytochrome oxidoreductase complex cytochrome b subunit
MQIVVTILQLIIALGILNVWLLRFGKPSPWRGGEAKNMKDEFAVYGLSETAMYGVGFLKILFAVLLIAAIWLPVLTLPASLGLAVLMLGAIVLHFRAGDPASKSLPAGTVLILCLLLAVLARGF